ncbi:MAG: penicillin-binding protein 1C [Rhizobiaceae bacterium]|nr:penicillin-binding protein 1C [Rhizobiaceae bacterium]
MSRRAFRRLRAAALGAAAVALAAGSALWAADALDRTFPPPLDPPPLSAEVVDRDGLLLRAFATPEGRWRMDVDLEDIDGAFLDMLVAYEDRRFREHGGVDLMALARAAGQLIANRRIVSGGSTISMQLARLIEPRRERSFSAKLRQIARAWQIERRLSKDEILRRYLTLAPYGGNLEGVRAASLAWFGKEPKRLTLSEAALLVALPQSPEARRPDRHRDNALAARNRVLARMADAGLLDAAEVARASGFAVPAGRRDLPALAAHVARDVLAASPGKRRHEVSIRRPVQEGLEIVAREAAERLGPKVSVALVMADARTGEIIGEVGSPDFLDARRAGSVDMTRAVRSPGSTLKPFIYGLAFEEGMVAQETIIEDRPASFGGYRPRNFDTEFQGDVSIRHALQMSLNIPAVRLLDAIGPARLLARFRAGGVDASLPAGEAPGLAIGLGGVGLTLRDLVQLYTAWPNRGAAVRLSLDGRATGRGEVIDARSAWQIADILSGVTPPEGAPHLGIAYKTGTSYGYRDAWSVGFDGRHVLGVWVGRADGAPVPGLSGYTSAAPILFAAFKRSGVGIEPLPRAPAGALRQARADLPVTLAKFVSPDREITRKSVEPAPAIVFPPDGARIDLGAAGGDASPLVLKLQGGRAPFRWLANGEPLAELSRRRTSRWQPDGAGFSRLTVIDAAGRAASVKVFVE